MSRLYIFLKKSSLVKVTKATGIYSWWMNWLFGAHSLWWDYHAQPLHCGNVIGPVSPWHVRLCWPPWEGLQYPRSGWRRVKGSVGMGTTGRRRTLKLNTNNKNKTKTKYEQHQKSQGMFFFFFFFTKETFRSYSLENPWWHTQPGKFPLNCGAGNY